MLSKKIIKNGISIFHYSLLTTSKLLIGIGVGIIIANHYWYVQPYWYLLIVIGALILIPTLYNLMKIEVKEEELLKKKIGK